MPARSPLLIQLCVFALSLLIAEPTCCFFNSVGVRFVKLLCGQGSNNAFKDHRSANVVIRHDDLARAGEGRYFCKLGGMTPAASSPILGKGIWFRVASVSVF